MLGQYVLDPDQAIVVKTDTPTIPAVGVIGYREDWSATQAAAASTTGVHAAAACAVTAQTVTTSITNPPCARNISATTSGTAADVAAVQVIIYGTDINGDYLTETLPVFTVNTADETKAGSKAFASVTSYYVPAMDGTGCSVSIGWGDKLGLRNKLSRKTLVYKGTFLADTVESTEPTLAISSTVLASNTLDLNSALDGTAVKAYFLFP